MENLEVLKEKIKNVHIAFAELEYFERNKKNFKISKKHLKWIRNRYLKTVAEYETALNRLNSNAISLFDINVTKSITTAELAAMIDASYAKSANNN